MPEFLRANARLHHYRFQPGAARRAMVFANSLGTDLRIWEDVIARIPSDIPILAYDKSGHGLSEAGSARIEVFAADLAALMDQKGLRDALICGVSVGGMIAQALASARPDLVAGLVLCNTSHRIGTKENWAARMAALENTGLDAMADGILERWFAPAFRKRRPDLVSGYRMMLTRTSKDGYRNVCAAIRDADLTDTTRRLTCPTLCLAGAEDQATPAATVRAMSDLLTNADFICLPELGHLPCIEAPDLLAGLLIRQFEALP